MLTVVLPASAGRTRTCKHAGVTRRPSKGRSALPALRRSRLLLLVLLLAVPAVVLTACSGDDGGTDASAQQLIDQTFTGKKKVDSGKVNLDLSAKLEATGAAAAQLEGPISLKLTGPFQSRGEDKLPEVDFDMTISAGGQKFTAGAVTTQDQAFIAYQGTNYRIPQDQFERYKRQVERQSRQQNSEQQNQFDLATLGVNPRDWLSNPKKEGEEDVGGAETVHVSADVRIGALLKDVNDLIRRAGRLGLQSDQVPDRIPPRTLRQIEDRVQLRPSGGAAGAGPGRLRRHRRHQGRDRRPEQGSRDRGAEEGPPALGAPEPARSGGARTR
jgi:hypothetical protein